MGEEAIQGPSRGSSELDDERLEQLEREHVEQLARAHEALAAAQDRSYWLDRWGVDLNDLMRRPAAARVRAALRALREVKRAALAVERYAQARRGKLREARADDEAAATGAGRSGPGVESAGDGRADS